MTRNTISFPDDLYKQIRVSAAANRRSINAEILTLIGNGLAATPTPAERCGRPHAVATADGRGLATCDLPDGHETHVATGGTVDLGSGLIKAFRLPSPKRWNDD